MSVQREIPAKFVLDRVADERGVAIVIVDRDGIEISASNDNSICRNLNPDGELVGICSAFCGMALEEAIEIGTTVSYTCHAGLTCRATAMMLDGKPAAVIVGRTFVNADNYRKATERAISGDWQKFPPSDFFENVLLSGTADTLEKALAEVEILAAVITRGDDEAAETPNKTIEQTPPGETVTPTGETETILETQFLTPLATTANKMAEEITLLDDETAITIPKPSEPVRPAIEIGAWRSFFSSLLSQDYVSACDAILEFVGNHYGFRSLVWLERRDNRLATVAAYGSLKNRKLKLGIPADDARLIEAVRTESPVELTERAGTDGDTRTMYLFPVSVGSDIPSALAVLDTIADKAVISQIVRLCHSVGPQLEILRLRSEVSRRDTLALAVRRFGDGLKHVDSDDFWVHMTQIAAELMQAERGSLLVVDGNTGNLEIKAAVGIRGDISGETDPGSRVAHIILDRGKPAVVADVNKIGLPPFPVERAYKTPSFLCAPVALGGRNIGVISFTDKATGAPFDRTDLELLQELTPQIAVAIDRAILKEKAGEFEQLSVTDALTGLLNRRYIEERLFEEVKRSNRQGYPMSYISLDVDHFKSYNDNFGHPAGDEALKIVAHVMRETLREADVAARVGGEEFVILLPQTTKDEAVAIAERLRGNVESAKFPCRKVTISVGVASCSSELCTTDGIVFAADKALYAAKHSGRNVVRIYDEIEAGESGS